MRKYLAFLIAAFLVVIVAIGWSSANQDSAKPGKTQNPLTGETKGAENIAPELAEFYTQTLSWSDCKDSFECATFNVPIDYTNPANGTMHIAITRLIGKAANGNALVVNPGGPGGSGIDYAQAAQYALTQKLIDSFDIVGFDPRGVGKSSPIDCMNDKETDDFVSLDGTPDDQAEIDATIVALKKIADQCAEKSPSTFAFIDTVSAAKDIDILRALLGNEKLNWLGKSYGTFLGATYADLFPQNVGRMVLDGAIDPALSNEELSHGQALGFENALNRFVIDCPKHKDCPLKAKGAAGVTEIMDFVNSFDANPVILDDGREFTQAMALTGVLGSLYDKQYGWESLRASLKDAFKGDYTQLVQNVDWYISRNEDGTYADNSNDAIMDINCLDRQDRLTLEQTQADVIKWKAEAPNFGDYLAWGNLSCTYWKAPATGVARSINAEGTPTILVVGTTNDPATPYPWAQSLAKQLSKGVLLTNDGDGHTAYFQGSKCVDDYVDNYFLTGQASPGVTCSDGP